LDLLHDGLLPLLCALSLAYSAKPDLSCHHRFGELDDARLFAGIQRHEVIAYGFALTVADFCLILGWRAAENLI